MPVRDLLPFEDLDAGLYVHEHDRVLKIEYDKNETYYVDVEHFMDVQAERDEYRRAAALVNAAIRRGDIKQAILILDRSALGLDEQAAKAMDGVIAWARSETEHSDDGSNGHVH